MRSLLSIALIIGCIGLTTRAQTAQPMVSESARQIPVAYDVDVVVVGGSSGAVAAAVAAADAGARVFLAAPRPYLGEDLCATMRLWLDDGEVPSSPLARRLFTDDTATEWNGNALPFVYEANLPSAGVHKDTDPPSRLTDGILGPAETQSVQYNGDVTITADLKTAQSVKDARILVFHREGGDFNAESVTIQTSTDQREWKTVSVLECANPQRGAISLSAPVGQMVRYARFLIKRRPGAGRVLVGEIALTGEQQTAATNHARGPVRPMHVKKTLDDALLAGKVQYLYSCYATDVLRDGKSNPCGIVMANRAGRQAVLAKVIIDATDRAWVARRAGAEFSPYARGLQTFQYTVIGGEAKRGGTLNARKVAAGYREQLGRPQENPQGCDVIEYTLQIPMADGGFAALNQAEQIARDLTYSENWAASTDELFQVPPDAMKATKPWSGPWQGVQALDLGAFRPAKVARLFVLGGCADLPRDQAARLLRPLALMKMGTRIGSAAAEEARTLPAIQGAKVDGAKATPVAAGDVRESLSGVRPSQQAVATVNSPDRSLPVLGEYDVVVVGGGTGGAPAGISAGRNKARTLVLEYLHGLGGVGTMGLISRYYWGYRGGFTAEVPGLDRDNWNPLHKAEWYRRTLREAGAEIWFGAMGCGAFVQGGRVRGVVVATPQGRGVVLAKVVIDSTGNADIAAAAGVQTMHTGADEVAQQGTGLPPVSLGAGYTNTDFTIVDETDLVDVWHVLVYAKNKYAASFDFGQLIDTRERRRIVGDFTMALPDQINARTYPDTISVAYSNFDTHGYTVDPYLLMEHPEKKGITVNIPYRCLLPSGLDGILVTGLGISVHRDAVPLTRMQPDIQNQGYAAGLIAATAAKHNRPLREVDLPAIQKQLAKIGIIPESAIGAQDSYPLPLAKVAEAVAAAKEGKGMAVIATHAEAALPLLREAYAAAASPRDKLTYARVLAALGDKSGVETLIAALEAASWDKGWNYTGMGQYGNSLSDVDMLIVALGRTQDRRAVPAILKKVAQLDATSAFSHHRAVALALEMIGDAAAAAPLATLLSKPGLRGHATVTVDMARHRSGMNPNDNSARATSLRELSLGRALYRCGDQDGLGRKILLEYTQDLRGHLARHAQAVLDERR